MSALAEMLGELALAVVMPTGERTPSWLGGAIVLGAMAAVLVALFWLGR